MVFLKRGVVPLLRPSVRSKTNAPLELSTSAHGEAAACIPTAPHNLATPVWTAEGATTSARKKAAQDARPSADRAPAVLVPSAGPQAEQISNQNVHWHTHTPMHTSPG